MSVKYVGNKPEEYIKRKLRVTAVETGFIDLLKQQLMLDNIKHNKKYYALVKRNVLLDLMYECHY
jgi:hypothetical protein